jgi:hypothetical protein
VRTVVNGGYALPAGAPVVIQVRQYVGGLTPYTGTVVGTVQSVATKFNSATFYCNGTDWVFLSGSTLE